jgi:hypothetical protein
LKDSREKKTYETADIYNIPISLLGLSVAQGNLNPTEQDTRDSRDTHQERFHQSHGFIIEATAPP